MKINYLINELIEYGIKNNLIEEIDKIYVANKLIARLNIDVFSFEDVAIVRNINEILSDISKYAYDHNIIDSLDITTTDLFDTEIMDYLIGFPSAILNKFNNLYKENKVLASNYLYDLAIKSNYIRKDRINKNINYKYESKYGIMDITINLSKPEKDPKIIAMAKNIQQTGYPKCALCKENMGFKGDLNHQARQNHRIIPLMLNNEKYYFQYSPYVYYNEHSIVFNENHIPMVIDEKTIKNLVSFVDIMPHYFIGSNADLPIVGGSILTHDHYQGGNYIFPMFLTGDIICFPSINDVKISYINWPLDTLKLVSSDKEKLIYLAKEVIEVWKNYSNESINLISNTNDVRHNTITPIIRYVNGEYNLYLVLRNNLTSDIYPYGYFHPRQSYHHIKKENIGLIEVMGLAVLPKRLKEEIEELSKVLVDSNLEYMLDTPLLKKHKDWYYEIKNLHDYNIDNVFEYLKEEIGKVFVNVLEDCSVFKFGNKEEEITKFVNKLKQEIKIV